MSLNKPVAYVRQPLLSSSSRGSWVLALGLLLGAGCGAAAAALQPVPSPAAMAVGEAGLASSPAPAVATTSPVATKAWVEEQRKRILTARIADTYHKSLDATRRIVESAHVSGKRHGVDPVLLLAIAAVESSFDPRAESSAGALGLIQAMPAAHPEKFERLRAQGKSPFDPAASMELGGEIYAEYSQWYDGNRTLALQQYNGNLKDKTRRYSTKVMKAYTFLSSGLPTVSHPS